MQISGMDLDLAILHHLAQSPVADQSDLLGRLRAEGFDLTLSTLSRHLKKLGVRKEGGHYQMVGPQRPAPPRFTIRPVPPCLLVLRTGPGLAMAMALALDQADLPSLAGTIAGDDTIFAAPVAPDRLEQLEREILERVGQGR